MLTKAIELDAGDFNAIKGMAKFCMAKEEMEEAEKYLKRSYSIKPSGEILLIRMVLLITRKTG